MMGPLRLDRVINFTVLQLSQFSPDFHVALGNFLKEYGAPAVSSPTNYFQQLLPNPLDHVLLSLKDTRVTINSLDQ